VVQNENVILFDGKLNRSVYFQLHWLAGSALTDIHAIPGIRVYDQKLTLAVLMIPFTP